MATCSPFLILRYANYPVNFAWKHSFAQSERRDGFLKKALKLDGWTLTSETINIPNQHRSKQWQGATRRQLWQGGHGFNSPGARLFDCSSPRTVLSGLHVFSTCLCGFSPRYATFITPSEDMNIRIIGKPASSDRWWSAGVKNCPHKNVLHKKKSRNQSSSSQHLLWSPCKTAQWLLEQYQQIFTWVITENLLRTLQTLAKRTHPPRNHLI